MRLSRGRLIAGGLVILTLLGFVFLRGPTPAISIKAETIESFGPVDLTNTMLTSWIVVIIMIAFVYFGTRRRDLVPRGFQNMFEAALEAFYNMVVSVAGEKNGRRFFPVVATIFFFILVSNWLSLFPMFSAIGLVREEEHGFVMERTDVGPLPLSWVALSSPSRLSGDSIDEDDPDAEERAEEAREDGKIVGELIPLFRGPNTDLNTPLALAIVSAIAVESWGIASLGLGAYGRKFFNFGGMFRGLFRLNFGQFFKGGIDAFVGILELISEMVRLISFTFRLFGNMFAGEVVILMFTFLTPVILTVAFYGLEVFIGIIQAFIFAMLTLVFAVMAVSSASMLWKISTGIMDRPVLWPLAWLSFSAATMCGLALLRHLLLL
ncbi:MAG: F0F1 ATP synthase subunit A [Chloroflexi bacterium]|nr:F0F1 ATP synthase subunit A [Chloroflexota bacterium]